jgi:hypothetical protein
MILLQRNHLFETNIIIIINSILPMSILILSIINNMHLGNMLKHIKENGDFEQSKVDRSKYLIKLINN